MRLGRGATAALAALALSGCEKVPIYGVEAGFSLSDAAWFEEEETLFLFYEVSAEQGIGEPSLIEVTYRTDSGLVDWTDIETLPTVHTHLPVDCGDNGRCGSASLHVPLEPRDVSIRLRYHRDGELALVADTIFNAIGPGPAHANRSLILYGVFDASNEWIQWRARHQFPTLRNEQVEELGLRRSFTIQTPAYGDTVLNSTTNPYGYNIACPSDFEATGLTEVQTNARAIFSAEALPTSAGDASVVCAQSTVTDGTGTFSATVNARKNPEVRSAFPVLRSPVAEAAPIRFFLAPCDRTISAAHEEMQRQRLMMEQTTTYCIDDWDQPDFVDSLSFALTEAVEDVRPNGEDMVLLIGLHQDEDGVSEAVEAALAQVVPEERHRSSPRLAGAFVFDSTDRRLSEADLSLSTLWCPSQLPGAFDTSFPDASVRTCAILPDLSTYELGPFTFGSLPILAPRDQYLDFIDEFSVSQAGTATDLYFLAPEFATTADHIDYGDFGVVTFLNEEHFSADRDDAFSYCAQDIPQAFAFRSPFIQSPAFSKLLEQACAAGKLSAEACDLAALGVMPIETLSEWHNQFRERDYELGLFWDFPFLARMEYEAVGAGSVGAFGLTIPFGFASDGEAYYGTEFWNEDSFSLEDLLAHCRRFCDHPTFDSAGVYHVTDPFRSTYVTSCYTPAIPALGDGGFPRDP